MGINKFITLLAVVLALLVTLGSASPLPTNNETGYTLLHVQFSSPQSAQANYAEVESVLIQAFGTTMVSTDENEIVARTLEVNVRWLVPRLRDAVPDIVKVTQSPIAGLSAFR
ncbi:hypothetical protein DFS34DRAFT_655209, partial [Phlyctochytrium arcticum]